MENAEDRAVFDVALVLCRWGREAGLGAIQFLFCTLKLQPRGAEVPAGLRLLLQWDPRPTLDPLLQTPIPPLGLISFLARGPDVRAQQRGTWERDAAWDTIALPPYIEEGEHSD